MVRSDWCILLVCYHYSICVLLCHVLFSASSYSVIGSLLIVFDQCLCCVVHVCVGLVMCCSDMLLALIVFLIVHVCVDLTIGRVCCVVMCILDGVEFACMCVLVCSCVYMFGVVLICALWLILCRIVHVRVVLFMFIDVCVVLICACYIVVHSCSCL